MLSCSTTEPPSDAPRVLCSSFQPAVGWKKGRNSWNLMLISAEIPDTDDRYNRKVVDISGWQAKKKKKNKEFIFVFASACMRKYLPSHLHMCECVCACTLVKCD